MKEHQVVVETCLMVIFGFFAFYVSEFLNFSGLLSIFCFIIIHTNYSTNILKKESNESIKSLLKTGAYLCEAIAFIYLGINSFYIFKDENLFSTIFISIFIMFGICIIRWISIGFFKKYASFFIFML